MSYVRPLGPITPNAGAYEVFSAPNCSYAMVQIQNGAVDYSIGQGDSTMQATFSSPDDTLLPGSGTILGPLQAIRFKAHTPVSVPPPQISIRAEKTLPLGVSLASAWTPSYATIAADGSIGAAFTGHVSAQGLDLNQAGAANPPDANKLRFLRADQTNSGELYDYGDGNSAEIILQSISRNNAQARIELASLRNSNAGALLRITSDADGTFGIYAITGIDAAHIRRILDDAGVSDYQLWGPWTALAINGTNWQALAGVQPPQYRTSVRPGGRTIEFRGQVQSITPIALAFAATGRISTLAAGFAPTTDQARIAPGTDPGAGNVVWGLDVTSTGVLYVFREHTGRALTLTAGVVVDIDLTYSTE